MKQWLFWKDIFNRHKRVEITIETKQTLQIRRVSKDFRKFCPLCRMETVFLTLSDSASLLQMNALKIEILLAGGKVHFADSAENGISICLESLKTEIEKKIN